MLNNESTVECSRLQLGNAVLAHINRKSINAASQQASSTACPLRNETARSELVPPNSTAMRSLDCWLMPSPASKFLATDPRLTPCVTTSPSLTNGIRVSQTWSNCDTTIGLAFPRKRSAVASERLSALAMGDSPAGYTSKEQLIDRLYCPNEFVEQVSGPAKPVRLEHQIDFLIGENGSPPLMWLQFRSGDGRNHRSTTPVHRRVNPASHGTENDGRRPQAGPSLPESDRPRPQIHRHGNAGHGIQHVMMARHP